MLALFTATRIGLVDSQSTDVSERPRIFRSRFGSVLTNDPTKAAWATGQLQAAATQFQSSFQVDPGPGLIIDMKFIAQANQFSAEPRRWVLPWQSNHFGSLPLNAQVEDSHHFNDVSGIRHELTHVFFTSAVVPSTKQPQYGSDAPDWLDEAVAISAETATSKAKRRSHFYRQVCSGRVMRLDRFVQMSHPLMSNVATQKLIQQRRNNSQQQPAMLMMDAGRLGLKPNELMDFYGQANAVAEYLRDTTGDAGILRAIAQVADGSVRHPAGKPSDFVASFVKTNGREHAAQFETWARSKASAAIAHCGDTR